MDIRAILPSWPPESPEHGETCADFLTAFVAAIHLDRTTARALGWRGLRPCMGTGHAWTCRESGLPGVFGMAFLEEQLDFASLRGQCSLFYFPDPAEPVLSRFSVRACDLASSAEYFSFVREFACREAASLYHLGGLRLGLRLDGLGLELSVRAPARNRILRLGEGSEEREQDIPALRLVLPLFRLLTNSLAAVFAEAGRFAILPERFPLPAFDQEGNQGVLDGQFLPGAALHMELGESIPSPEEKRRRPLAARRFHPAVPEKPDENLPLLHVVSGFLGSGKTTFISEWLAWLHNHDRYTGVLQNELGAIGLDAALLAEETLTEALDEGCVCCTLADSLRPAVRRLCAAGPTEQIILETTGLANPALVAAAVRELGDMVRPGLALSLADALTLQETARAGTGLHGLAAEQIRHARVLVLNKTDAVDPAILPSLRGLLTGLNPSATLLESVHGRVPFGLLDALAENNAAAAAPALSAFSFLTHADEGYVSLLLAVPGPVARETLAALADAVAGRVARIKGIVTLADTGTAAVVQYAASRLRLEDAPSRANPDRFLVLIGKGIDNCLLRLLERFPDFTPRPARDLPGPELPA